MAIQKLLADHHVARCIPEAVRREAGTDFLQHAGASLLTHISWPPYAWAHAAGLAGGLIVVWGARGKPLHGCPDPLIDKPVPVNQYSDLEHKTMLP